MKYLPAIILKWSGLVFSGLVVNAILFGIITEIGISEGLSGFIALIITIVAIVSISKIINKSISKQIEPKKCKRCGNLISFWSLEFCAKCKKDKSKAINLLDQHGITPYCITPQLSRYGRIFGRETYTFIKKEQYDDVMDSLIKNNFNIEKIASEFYVSLGVMVEEEEKKKRNVERHMREKIEQRVYGQAQKKKRRQLTEEEKDIIFDKFHNQCTTCGQTEGLHIHHKDQNPSNNTIENLSVLCGVCHKKVHMKVR